VYCGLGKECVVEPGRGCGQSVGGAWERVWSECGQSLGEGASFQLNRGASELSYKYYQAEE